MATDDTAPGNGETQPLQQEQETPQKPQRKKPDPTPTMPEREDAHALTVVGIGASAGGVQALQTFFENAPTDSGSAYIVVLHLSPDHASHLAEIIGRATGMPVRQVTDVVKVEADHVYVIPPSRHLEMEDGLLRPTEPESARGRRVAIDLFFRTLADTHGPQSVAVVLSGSGADGALGLRQIKERGGLTMAQDPLEAEYDGMPRSAIATGMVDFVLPAGNLARRIADYWDTSRRMRLPEEAAPSPPQRDDGPDQEAALRAILAHVRAQTGHDFAQYKRATILRRIGRRLQVNGAEDLPGYLEFVRRHPAEVGDLVKDVLISVTQFFRDASAWAALDREVVPRLFEGRRPDEAVRAWVCGCATGEEAYTLAILLQEYAQKLDRAAPPIQIFATDMDADAIARARVGVYPDTIAADVSQERLRRWFTHQNGAYRVKKEVRESVLFAAHDVLRDTPFSRLDLITCRNLLIYLEQAAQQRVYETFHFALRPGGRLLLGSSEAVDSAPGLFTPVDKQHRIYLSRPVARSIAPIPVGVSAADMPSVPIFRESGPPGELPTGPADSEAAASAVRGTAILSTLNPLTAASPLRNPPVGELHRHLLEMYAPPSILIGAEQEIMHMSDAAAAYLRHAGGVPTSNLLRLVLPGLRIELRAALYAAAADGREQTRLVRGVLEEGGARRSVRMVVRPVREPEAARGYCLVLFEELTEAQADATSGATASARASTESAGPAAKAAAVAEAAAEEGSAEVARHLEEQIGRLQMQLLSTVEQYEASAEELKASNEELQAMNEELRSAAEELETSKEELQSLNEELTTVNQELKGRMDEVNRTNSDLQNLLVSTDIATIFLDRELRLKRYTPVTEQLFNVIPTDIGRPLVHLTHRLNYPALADDVERVLDRLVPVEREVMTSSPPPPAADTGAVRTAAAAATEAGSAAAPPRPEMRHFLARLLPYRTLDDRIDGVVLTFIDITARKRSEEALRASEARLATIFSQAAVGLSEIGPGGKFLRVNDRLCQMVGRSREELLKLGVADITHPEDRAESDASLARTAATGEPLAVEKRCIRPDGGVVWTNTLLSRLDGGEGREPAVLAATVDLTARLKAERAQRESEERFRLLVEGADEYAMLLIDRDRRITFWSTGAERLFGWRESEALGMPADALFTPEDRERGVADGEMETAPATGRAQDERWHVRKDGSRFWADGMLMRLDDDQGNLRGFAKITRDATERVRAAEELRMAKEGLEASVGERTADLSAALSSVEIGLAERNDLLRRLVNAQEEERARISRELHDELGQHLTAFSVGLRTFADAHPEGSEALERLREIASEMSREVHRIAVELRPTALDDLGLVPALESYVQQWQERTGVRVVFHTFGMDERPSPEAEAAIYRVVQEALTNVARHALDGEDAATKVGVSLQRQGAEVRATVEDNGPGFDPEAAARSGRLGIAGMRERAQIAGGTLEVESAPGEGATVFLRLPMTREK